MKDSEAKFKDDFERASMDVQMLRERLDKTQNDLAKSRSEGDKAVGDLDKVSYELEKTTNQFNKAHNNLEKSPKEVARLQVRYSFCLVCNAFLCHFFIARSYKFIRVRRVVELLTCSYKIRSKLNVPNFFLGILKTEFTRGIQILGIILENKVSLSSKLSKMSFKLFTYLKL